ncbi:MAG: helix-turn-helix domain-containing protein [Hyphomicrobiaceae bacterium]
MSKEERADRESKAMSSLLTAAQREAFVRRVRIEMAKRGLTRTALAEIAGCKERTLGNLLAGQPVRDATVAGVARGLAIDLDTLLGTPHGNGALSAKLQGRADESYGGYLLSAYEDYLGPYLAYRRIFSRRNALYRSVYELDWDEDLSRLRFLELQGSPNGRGSNAATQHAGGVYISPHTGMLQLLTTFQGALRLVTLNRFQRGGDKLRGVILTQSDRERFYQPAVSAIFLQKLAGRQRLSELERRIGTLEPDHADFPVAMAEIEEIERSAIFLAGPVGEK